MMLRQELANRSWLANAFTLPLRSVEQSCYYDYKYDHFFTLRPHDFLAFNQGDHGSFDIDYTKTDANMFRDKFERLRQTETTILHIPRLSIENRMVLQAVFADSFKGMYHHALLVDTVASQDDLSSLGLDKLFFDDKHFPEIRSYWEKHKNNYLTKVIDDFIFLYKLNLPLATIWEASKLSVELKVKAPKPLKKKTWHRLW